MQIQIHTDHNIVCHEPRAKKFRDTVENALSDLKDHITRVDVHLSDENSDKKSGFDAMRCKMEAHIEGRPAIAVTDQATTVDQAVEGATEKLINLVEHTLGRVRDLRHHPRPHEPNALKKP